MKTVELKTAYHWHCENCAAENFAMPQRAELSDEDREEAYRTFNDMDVWTELPDDWQNFELIMIPNVVKCGDCGTRYRTEDETDPDGD